MRHDVALLGDGQQRSIGFGVVCVHGAHLKLAQRLADARVGGALTYTPVAVVPLPPDSPDTP